ncbi:helix-turn-helix domain-containing protein [Nocardia sp. NPDC101769]|uniref:helix-turn-helix domain-containing protein n=1 Tax=Nocardia sp. NPDC101769 TaxID=3364333 RepID=UPI00382D40D5
MDTGVPQCRSGFDPSALAAATNLDISHGKMSGLWTGTPTVLRPEELDVFWAVLDCGIGELMTAEPATVVPPAATTQTEQDRAVGAHDASPVRRIVPKPRSGRSLPPR